jgi:hypothetical protein
VRLAVGTHAQLIDLELDDRFRVTRETIVGRGHYYGIALLPGPDNTVLCKHDLGIDRLAAQGGAPLRRLDRQPHAGGVKKAHQIAYGDDGIYLANTDANSLLFRGADGRESELHLYGNHRDVNHVNSVFPCASGVLVMLHNWFERPSEIVLVARALGGELQQTATIRLPDRGCHNVFIDGRRLLYNASEAGKVVALDLERRRKEKAVVLGGHTKGLSATADHVVVGCSPHVRGGPRFDSKGGLVVLDRRTLAVVAEVGLGQEGPVGNVNEIRALDGLESAHAGDATLPDGFSSFHLREKLLSGRAFRVERDRHRRHRH